MGAMERKDGRMSLEGEAGDRKQGTGDRRQGTGARGALGCGVWGFSVGACELVHFCCDDP